MGPRIARTLGPALLLLWTASAAASADPPPPPPLAHLWVAGEATVRDLRVTVRCAAIEGGGVGARCRLASRYTLEAAGPVMLRPRYGGARGPEGEPGALRVDGAPLGGERVLAGGEAVRVGVEATRVMQASRRRPFLLPPNRARHPLLGDDAGAWRAPPALGAPLADGPRVRLEGPVHADVEPGPARVTIGGEAVRGVRALDVERATVRLTLPRPPSPGSPVQHGGPALGLGARLRFQVPDDEGRWLLRVGYELAFFEHLIGSVWLETDFESVMEVLQVELALPQVLFLIPSAAVGVGVVARQLGPRAPDAALRLHVGWNVFALGMSGDFDYWPALGGWTGSLSVRVSL
jgi:hypothetical protein